MKDILLLAAMAFTVFASIQCSDFYSTHPAESCTDGTYYYNCVCDPMTGGAVCESEECPNGCDSQGFRCASAFPQTDCIQDGASETVSGCTIDSLCPDSCAQDEYQLLSPACSCFPADFSGTSIALAKGESLEVTRGSVPLTGTEIRLEYHDRVKTGEKAMILYPDGAYVLMEPDSELEMNIDGFLLLRGECWIKAGGGRAFEVNLEDMFVGGTENVFTVWSDGGESGARAVDEPMYANYFDSHTHESHNLNLPSGSMIVYDKPSGAFSVYEGDGLPISSELSTFTSEVHEFFGTWGHNPKIADGECFCVPAIALLCALFVVFRA